MKGKVLDFNQDQRTGIISADDGSRYEFDMEQWKGSSLPKAGDNVDFQVTDGKAEGIYGDNITSQGASKRIGAALFAFFLGAFGAHKFYLGYTKQGVIMLLVFIFGFILLGLPSIVIGIIAFVEFILYLVKSDEEFEQTYIIGNKGWF